MYKYLFIYLHIGLYIHIISEKVNSIIHVTYMI